jgi:hypothetical protein
VPGFVYLIALVAWGAFFLVAWAIHAWVGKPLAATLHRRIGLPKGAPSDLMVSATLIAGIVLASYLPGMLHLRHLCEKSWGATIDERVSADGYYLPKRYVDHNYAGFLLKHGFTFVESSVQQKPGEIVRFTRSADGKIERTVAESPKSAYGVREAFSHRWSGVSEIRTVVFELRSGRELARMSEFSFDAGPILPMFFVQGSSCRQMLGPAAAATRGADESFVAAVLGRR